MRKTKEASMSKNRNRKETKKHLRPPLTFLDKSIYFLGILFSLLAAMLSVIFFSSISDVIAFSKPGTVAYSSHASSLLVFPVVLFLEISTIALLVGGWQSKKPIFGSKKYKYGEYPYKEDCFPIFSRKKRCKNPSQKKFARKMIALWFSILTVLACLLPFGLFGRNAIYQDNRIETINFLNIPDHIYTVDDFAHLTIRAKYVSGYKSPGRWEYGITIKMTNGESFYFSNRDFNGPCLDKMLEIKELFAQESITVKGAGNLGKVSDFLGYDAKESAKLQRLFS
jgi:hypothetical protein